MIHVASADLYVLIASFLWPFTRIAGMIAVAPLFGNVAVPKRIKIVLSAWLAFIVAPSIPEIQAHDPFSLSGILILTQQFAIGLTMGFTMRIALATAEMAGALIGMTMGLGFASFFDPQTRGQSSVISQFFALLMLMVYLAGNLHLVVLSTLAHSFTLLPISSGMISGAGFFQLAHWGACIFSAGVQLSLPVVAALLITNTALGILARAAPQLNLFGIGFPMTIGAGFLITGTVLPYLSNPIIHVLQAGITSMNRVTLAFLMQG